jgi:hypothetical protein
MKLSEHTSGVNLGVQNDTWLGNYAVGTLQ